MSFDDVERHADESYRSAQANHNERETRQRNLAARYESMIVQVEAWPPPTPDHEQFKQFMLEQLRESLRFDCGHLSDPPQRLCAEEYRSQKIGEAQWDMDYHEKNHMKELQLTDERNAWVDALRKSLGNPPRECEPRR